MKGKYIPPPSKEMLEKLYFEDNLPPSRISEKFKVGRTTVQRWFEKYNIVTKRPTFSNIKTNLTESQKAYLAGYLDGDGTITICKSTNKNKPDHIGIQKDVSLITSIKWFAEELQKLIGGNIQTFIYYDSRHKKEGYRVSFTNQESALAFLREIQPYLILKRKQAKLMIELLEERLALRHLHGNGAKITPHTWELTNEIRNLNHQR
jgi:hypothetical protein